MKLQWNNLYVYNQKPKGEVEFSFDWSLEAQMHPIIREALPIHEGMLCKFSASPNKKLSKIINVQPNTPNRKGLYKQSLFSLNSVHKVYDKRRRQSGTKYVLIEVTLTPKAAMLEAMVLE